MDESGKMSDDKELDKKTLILKTRKPFDLQTDNLGVVKVGRMTMKALMLLSPSLDPMKDTDDKTLVRAMMVSVSKIQNEDGGEDGRALSNEEIQLITDTDLERFAKAFMEEEKWEVVNDDQGKPLAHVPALAKSFRVEVEKIGESTRKTMESLKGILSPVTQQLFMKNTALSERLKELGGINTAFANMQNILPKSLLDMAKVTNGISSLGSFSALKNIGINQEMAEMAKPISLEHFKSPQIDFSNSPAAKTSRTVEALDHKAEEIMEIAREMAVAHGNTNEMIGQAMAQFEVKRISDTKDIKDSLNLSSYNLKVAMYSLIVSVLIGAASLWYAYSSYKIAKEADLTSNEQTQALKELVSIQRDEKAKLQQEIDRLEENAARRKIKHSLVVHTDR